MVDREVDARERLARVVDDLQVGGALRRVLDGLAHRTHFGRHEHVDRGERILVRDRIGELAHRAFGRAAPPLPNIAVTASAPTPTSAAIPNAATSVPKRPRRCASGSTMTKGTSSSSMISEPFDRRTSGTTASATPLRASPRRARRRRRAASRAGQSLRVDHATHSPDDSLLSSARKRRRARNSATRALPLDIPTAFCGRRDLLTFDLDQVQQRAHARRQPEQIGEIARIRVGRRAVGRDLRRARRRPARTAGARRSRGSRPSAAGTGRDRGSAPGCFARTLAYASCTRSSGSTSHRPITAANRRSGSYCRPQRLEVAGIPPLFDRCHRARPRLSCPSKEQTPEQHLM